MGNWLLIDESHPKSDAQQDDIKVKRPYGMYQITQGKCNAHGFSHNLVHNLKALPLSPWVNSLFHADPVKRTRFQAE